MPSLRSNQKYKEMRAQLVRLNHLKRHLDKLIEAFQIPDSAVLLSALQKRIHRLESVIEEYEDCKRLDEGDILASIKTIPERLAQIRIWLGWTQAELGRHAGLDGKRIHRYEKDKYLRTNLETILQIAAALETGVVRKREWLADVRRKRQEFRDGDMEGMVAGDDDGTVGAEKDGRVGVDSDGTVVGDSDSMFGVDSDGTVVGDSDSMFGVDSDGTIVSDSDGMFGVDTAGTVVDTKDGEADIELADAAQRDDDDYDTIVGKDPNRVLGYEEALALLEKMHSVIDDEWDEAELPHDNATADSSAADNSAADSSAADSSAADNLAADKSTVVGSAADNLAAES